MLHKPNPHFPYKLKTAKRAIYTDIVGSFVSNSGRSSTNFCKSAAADSWEEQNLIYAVIAGKFSHRMSPIVSGPCIVLRIRSDFSSFVLVIIRSFQLMKRIEISCLESRLEDRIGLMKT